MTATKITVPGIRARKGQQNRIVALTAYDYTFGRLLDQAGVDVVLVGDSLGTVIQGHETTLPVTLDEMIYHTRCVRRGVTRALVVADLPFLSYQVSAAQAIESAGRLLKEAGAEAVKLEGGVGIADTVSRLVDVDIPVMGHVGLTPQSFHRMGGHRIQGRRARRSGARPAEPGSRERIIDDAKALEAAGAFAIVVEGIPRELAADVTSALSVPTIGIGAGESCDGQVLVTYDLVGLLPWFAPRFVERYAECGQLVQTAAEEFIRRVRSGTFPKAEHSVSDPAGS